MLFSNVASLAAAAAVLPAAVLAAPQQLVFSAAAPSPEWDPQEHMSGIARYHDAPGADVREPPGCRISASAYLIRHSAIGGNDEEWEEYMQPFAQKVKTYQDNKGSFKGAGPLAFLKSWKSVVTEDTIEQITEPGRRDAFDMGKRMRALYPQLFPPKSLGASKKKGKKGKKGPKEPEVPFKIWTASSERDIDTSKAFIQGAFPKRHEGDGGEGDGKYVQLVEVPNKDPEWQGSLTPHKICPAWSKEAGKPAARTWLSHYGQAPLDRFKELMPDFDWQLDDIIAMQQMCGYEETIQGRGTSHFCKQGLFTEDDFRSFGYFFDLFYNDVVGYNSPFAPYMGAPWLNISTHNILAVNEPEHPHFEINKKKDPHLPDPDNPPDSTHTQRIFVYFTHREEPPVALVALGIWNQTAVGGMPTDRIPERDQYLWQTSHVLPFLGHVALQRLECGDHSERAGSYVRVVVNGAAQKLPSPELADGPGNSCAIDKFEKYVAERVERYADFEGACRKDEE